MSSSASSTALPATPAGLDEDCRQLLDASGLATYRQAVSSGSRHVIERLTQVQQPGTGISPAQLNSLVAAVDLQQPLPSLDAALAEAADLYLRDAIYFHHPRYVAHLNCPVLIPALAAEVILSALNSSLDTWDQSIGASLLEQKIIDWTARCCELDPQHADGVMTSGGTQSNLMALLLARDIAAARLQPSTSVREHGLPAQYQRLRILVSPASHFSVHKAAALLGLGHAAIITCASDSAGRLSVSAVAKALASCRLAGQIPMALVATAGTTDFGNIDPLPELAALCREHQLRMHVDAAYGGGLLVSPRYRSRLRGIELADSISIDYHKSWFQPVSCSAFLVRDRADWQHLTHHAEYLNPQRHSAAGRPDLVNKSLQTTRRFDAFKLWISLRSMGPSGIGRLFDKVIAVAADFHAWLLQQADLELPSSTPSDLSTLLCRYRPAGLEDHAALNRLNLQIREELFNTGRLILGGTRIDGRHYLKFTLLNPRTELSDLQAMVALIRQQAAIIIKRMAEQA